jgi:2-methylisocitrate lyase-like PEP mutase family enzyme
MSRDDRYQTFAKLHDRSALLLLPNAWDAASAKVIANAGAKAIATTSVGVATSLGFPDGNRLPRADAIDAVRRIAGAVPVPVTADLEEGFGDTPDEVAETAALAAAAGAVGLNIEDDTHPPERLAARIAAIAARMAKDATPLFINARIDAFLRGHSEPLAETLSRIPLYEAAGASGIFVPGAVQPGDIRTLCAATKLPVNVLTFPGLPPVGDLQGLGVARLSGGGGVHRAAMGVTDRVARAFLAGDLGPMAENGLAGDVFKRVLNS